MTVQRVDSSKKRTHGWQARVTVVGTMYLSKFYADMLYGGSEQALRLATAAEEKLQRVAQRLRKL